ncbi:type II toxin-antitoxin system RelE/ParE family toxin [Elioraea sp. Yellowstone]|jgi:plasmid stabilization system protein ParE|uniref:Type II toxin-antitoxin system RelE/ParE family toxin n=2 Tax=Caldovatus TaxID=2041181 RepID=A0A8J3ED53_9PROT|nr:MULTISPECIES: type II toxin-antitoxin system RelE/ParE family toxin [Rhodospirillales]TQF77566.1 type II toxin-antitoxin system RelE/ParE family toxin [Elioraea sp. Yellowstone]GGG39514.1 hypothetical protein GCM10010964_28850 [Caldovatus sediminis]
MGGKRPAILSAQARRDLAEAAAFIATDNPAAARRLREQVVAAAVRIGAYPRIGVVRPALAPEEVRFLVVPDFPYVIVYRATATPPRILRVLHGARDLQELLRDLLGGA